MRATQWLENLLVDHSIYNLLLMVAITVIVWVIKTPIKNKANDLVDYANNKGLKIDKAVITKNICILPFVVGFILFAVKELVIMLVDGVVYDITEVMACTVIYGALSITLYEVIDIQLKKSKSNKDYKEVKDDYKLDKKLAKSDLPVPLDSGEQIEILEEIINEEI